MNVIQTALKRHPHMVRWIQKTREKILAYPQSYDQGTFGEKAKKSPDHPCGAAACLAGQYAMVRGFHFSARHSRNEPHYIKRVKGRIVSVRPDALFTRDLFPRGLDTWEDDEAEAEATIDALFYSRGWWPEPFAAEWDAAGSDRVKQARVAARRLTHFLRKGE